MSVMLNTLKEKHFNNMWILFGCLASSGNRSIRYSAPYRRHQHVFLNCKICRSPFPFLGFDVALEKHPTLNYPHTNIDQKLNRCSIDRRPDEWMEGGMGKGGRTVLWNYRKSLAPRTELN